MKQNSKRKTPPNFIRYSSMAFQMAVIITAATFGGIKLDAYVKSIEFPLFTIVLTLLGVFAAVYLSIKDFINPKK